MEGKLKTAAEIAMEKVNKMEKPESAAEENEKPKEETALKNSREIAMRKAETTRQEIASETDSAEKMEQLAKEHGLNISGAIGEKEDSIKKMEVGLGGMSFEEDAGQQKKESVGQPEGETVDKKESGKDTSGDEKSDIKMLESLRSMEKMMKIKGKDLKPLHQALKEQLEKKYGDVKPSEEFKKVNEGIDLIGAMKKKKKERKDAEEKTEGEKTKTCSNCGKEGKLNDKFCRFCGTKFAEGEKTKVCAKCGAEGRMSANFCNKCGAKLAGEGESSIQVKIPGKMIIEKEGKPAISVQDFMRLNQNMDIEEIAEALKNSSAEKPDSQKELVVKDEDGAGNLETESSDKGNEKKEKSLEDQKKEAEDDFQKTLKAHELRVGEFPADERKNLVDGTLKAISEAQDDDFVDMALAKGMMEATKIAKRLKEEKK